MYPDLEREIDELYVSYVKPMICKWVLCGGALKLGLDQSITVAQVIWNLASVNVAKCSDLENFVCLCTSFDVPPDWEIPILTGNRFSLRLLLGDSKKPRSLTARYAAAIGGWIQRPLPEDKEFVLTIKVGRYREIGWNPEVISMNEGKLRANIAHELEHYLDPLLASDGYNPPSENFETTSLSKHFNYLRHQTEIGPTARSLVELAKHYGHSIKHELDHRIESVKKAVLRNPKIDPDQLEPELVRYRELLVDELVRRSPELKGTL